MPGKATFILALLLLDLLMLAHARVPGHPAPHSHARQLQQGGGGMSDMSGDNTATNSRSDRIAQAMSATSDAIQRATVVDVNGRRPGAVKAAGAAAKGYTYARLTTVESARPSDFN